MMKGIRSIWAMAAKSVRPLPVAHKELSEETRVRQRYVDLIMRPADVEDEGWSFALKNKSQIQPAATFHERPDAS